MQETNKLASFRIDTNMFGIDVDQVQEVTQNIALTPVPHAPKYVRGLLNLRGQIATAIGMRELFELNSVETSSEEMRFVICKSDNLLMALIVDEIGDVLDVEENSFEDVPETVSERIKEFVGGVYKLPSELLSVVSIEKIMDCINK